MPDFSHSLISSFTALGWLVPLLILALIVRSSWFKGHVGEWMVILSAKFLLPSDDYARFHNVTLPTPDGTTQIDHIFVSRFGVFVVETKNMKGWIFGSERQAQWTQKFRKQSYTFQNPLRQNFKHVKALTAALETPPDSIHSVVAFVGDATFKTAMPSNVTTGIGFARHIKSFTAPVLSHVDVEKIRASLSSKRLAPSWKTTRAHVRNLKTRANPSAERNCPKCGQPMVLRTVRRGANTGDRFWGCSGFPKCRIVQQLT